MPETTERDLITEVEELLAKATPGPWDLYLKGATPREPYSIRDSDGAIIVNVLFEPLTMEPEDAEGNARLLAAAPELLRRLVEEVKRDRDALKAMVELWDANHADDPCACTGADYSVGQHPIMCELCVARELMEGRNPNAE